jgi:hypothetical protein
LNLEKLETLGTQETGRRQAKQKHNRESKKPMSNMDPTQPGDETQAVLNFYKTPTMLLGIKHKQFLPFIRHPPCYWG